VVKGRVIVADAMFCQRELCAQVVEDDGGYLVAVKENQPGLLRDIRQEFAARDAAFSPLHAGTTAV
jgi:predicted transposase YbfD/YdcC